MLWLLLLQVSASCLWLGHSEVVNSFATCPQFFYQNSPPNNALQPANPAWICQRYDNQHYFATLYDRNRRIPVYSAYIYQPGTAPRPQAWLVEPQLIGPTYPKDMEKQKDFEMQYSHIIQQLSQSQAVLEDYQKLTGLTHGHLNPSGHHKTYKTRLTTFTLTNVVPQDQALNNGAWSRYEVGTMSKKSKGCTATYVIVGAVPGNSYIAKGRVNKPSHIWSAACCQTNTSMKAWAVIAENNKDQVELLTLGELEARLTKLYGRGQVSLFHRDCPR
ncbi:ENDD1 protein, partial [Menura novaehollandiae]|nr:ENDD1 protein [Menura novaehollandiae]